MALQALAGNRMRSALTTLGVLIGVMSVVLLVAIGEGARAEVTGAIEGLGSNLIIAVPGDGDFGSAPVRSPLTVEDVERVDRALGPPEGRAAGYLVSGETLQAEGGRVSGTVLGVTDAYLSVVSRQVARGQPLTASDELTGRRVALLGAGTAETLFGTQDPVGRTLSIGGVRFRVSGVLERVGGQPLGPNPDRQVLVPISAGQRLFGSDRLDTILASADSAETTDRDAAVMEETLGQWHEEGELSVFTQDEILGVAGEILQILTLVLAAIAGISLLVGGVGVSNIMLVSVSERTGEIGLRKALGARTRDITRQFLLEAVMLTSLGGLVGLGLGAVLARVVAAVSPVPAAVTLWSVALALGVSLAVGVVFGVWPARRAGRMDPVEALRHD